MNHGKTKQIRSCPHDALHVYTLSCPHLGPDTNPSLLSDVELHIRHTQAWDMNNLMELQATEDELYRRGLSNHYGRYTLIARDHSLHGRVSVFETNSYKVTP